jgi:hypothetical protein
MSIKIMDVKSYISSTLGGSGQLQASAQHKRKSPLPSVCGTKFHFRRLRNVLQRLLTL